MWCSFCYFFLQVTKHGIQFTTWMIFISDITVLKFPRRSVHCCWPCELLITRWLRNSSRRCSDWELTMTRDYATRLLLLYPESSRPGRYKLELSGTAYHALIPTVIMLLLASHFVGYCGIDWWSCLLFVNIVGRHNNSQTHSEYYYSLF